MEVEFKPWPKILRPRNMLITITEKMDGTNACVIIQNGKVVGAQSRSRLITVDNDNFGFAQFVEDNKEDLAKLGDGYHYGEWVGPGIQKNRHNLEEKTFYLFNTLRPEETIPECVKVVRVLYHGENSDKVIATVYEDLRNVEGYKPEGVVVYNHTTHGFVKYTYANQEGKFMGV